MNKDEFIKEVMRGFPQSFKGLDFDLEKKKYEIALENNLDFGKLYTLFIKDWQYRTAPAPAYFEKFFSQCRILKLINMPSERRAALVTVSNWVNSPEYEKCLYSGTKAPWHIREKIKNYSLTKEEIDYARTSNQLGEGEPAWN